MTDINGTGDVLHSSEIGKDEEGWYYLCRDGYAVGPFDSEQAAREAYAASEEAS